jgi:hypothetical protein
LDRLESFMSESSCQTKVAQRRKKIARGFNRGLTVGFVTSPAGTKENAQGKFLAPLRGLPGLRTQIPQLKLWAIFDRPAGATN